MNIYALEKHSATGPFHTDDGYLYSGNGNIIAQTSGDGCGCDLDMLKHCRNHFMEALEALSTAADVIKALGGDPSGYRTLIAKLEEVK